MDLCFKKQHSAPSIKTLFSQNYAYICLLYLKECHDAAVASQQEGRSVAHQTSGRTFKLPIGVSARREGTCPACHRAKTAADLRARDEGMNGWTVFGCTLSFSSSAMYHLTNLIYSEKKEYIENSSILLHPVHYKEFIVSSLIENVLFIKTFLPKIPSLPCQLHHHTSEHKCIPKLGAKSSIFNMSIFLVSVFHQPWPSQFTSFYFRLFCFCEEKVEIKKITFAFIQNIFLALHHDLSSCGTQPLCCLMCFSFRFEFAFSKMPRAHCQSIHCAYQQFIFPKYIKVSPILIKIQTVAFTFVSVCTPNVILLFTQLYFMLIPCKRMHHHTNEYHYWLHFLMVQTATCFGFDHFCFIDDFEAKWKFSWKFIVDGKTKSSCSVLCLLCSVLHCPKCQKHTCKSTFCKYLRHTRTLW